MTERPGKVHHTFDLLDELELLLVRKGRVPVLLVTLIALALCFLVVGILMATGIMLVTFFVFICFNDNPDEGSGIFDVLGSGQSAMTIE
uniref:Uncharacterized protein n=1 Tax=Anopheles farauti TaxID=69004 RepID=A0A182Q211_9DIPT